MSYKPEHDHSFGRQFGTDTTAKVATADLGIEDAVRREQAILYLASPPRVTRWMLDNIGVDYRHFTFVDLGCGKGRVLLIASEYPFQRVVGVEISSELSEIARQNAVRYQPASRAGRRIDVENVDALQFEFPTTNLLVHMYHPFEPELTREVLRHLEASVAALPRRVVIAYLAYTAAVEPVRGVFSEFGWLKQTRYEQSVRGQYNWIFYSN